MSDKTVIIYRTGPGVFQEMVWNYLVGPFLLLALAALICLLPGMLMTYFWGDVFGLGIYSASSVAWKNSALWAGILTLALSFVLLPFFLRVEKPAGAFRVSLMVSLLIYLVISVLILVLAFASVLVSKQGHMNVNLVKRGLFYIHDFLHDPPAENDKIPKNYKFAQGMAWEGDLRFDTGEVRTYKMTLERVTPLFMIARLDEITNGRESLIQSFFIDPPSTNKGTIFSAEDYKSNTLYSFSLTDDLQNLRMSWPASIAPNGKFKLVSAGL